MQAVAAEADFNTIQAHRLMGITVRRLQYWREHNLIVPRIIVGKGRGGFGYRFDQQLLFRAALIAKLMDHNLGVSWVRKRIDQLERATERFLLIEGRSPDHHGHWTCLLFDDEQKLICAAAKSANSILVIDLHELRRSVANKITARR